MPSSNNETRILKSMTNEAFIDYCMEMHCLSPEQKLLYLKELVDSMQENYEKPGFIQIKIGLYIRIYFIHSSTR